MKNFAHVKIKLLAAAPSSIGRCFKQQQHWELHQGAARGAENQHKHIWAIGAASKQRTKTKIKQKHILT